MHRERSQSNRRYGGGAAATDENFCSHCKRKIESGRRRLFTGPTQGKSRRPSLSQHDTMANIIMYSVCTSAVCTGDWQAPPGEYRYCCGVCEGFQLCTDCFDRHEQGNDQRMHFKVCTNAWQTQHMHTYVPLCLESHVYNINTTTKQALSLSTLRPTPW